MDELMTAARFEDIEVIDVTEAFLQTARAWQEAFVERETELKALIGTEWEERQLGRAAAIEGVEEGLLLRLLVTGTAPA